MAESTRKKEKKRELTFVEKMQKLARSGLSGSACPNPASGGVDELATIDERISQMLHIINELHRKPTNMLFFVMYDIESNKVRSQVVKYLIKKGCIRVQKSIFLADLDTSVYEEIRSDLAEVQAAYENEDSILIVPLSTDYLRAMKVIGKSINLDVITHSKSTLFF
jgi:CRISPR-associated protein Cas2